MKQKHYFIAALLGLFFGAVSAQADNVSPYAFDFNETISTTAHDFKVAPGWGHDVKSYYDDEEYETCYVSYTYRPSDGVDGSGALKIGSQKLGSGWSQQSVNDLLVTPLVTGASSIYVKATTSNGSIKFYTVTKDGAKYTRGSEITLDAKPTLSTDEWVKVEIPEQAEGAYIGIRGENVLIDNFAADNADIELTKAMKVDKVTNLGTQEPDCNAEGKFTISYAVKYTNVGDVTLTPGMENYSLSIVNYSKSNEVVSTKQLTKTLAVGEQATDTLTAEVDYATYPSRNRYDVMENLTQTTNYGQWIEPVAYAPAMQVRTSNGRIDAGENFAYGMINEPTQKEFIIRSTGAAPLNVTAIDVPEGFTTNVEVPFTLAAHKDTTFALTLGTDVPGIFSGDVVVKADDVADFTFAVSGTVLDPSKYFVPFADENVPSGMVLGESWNVSQRDYTDSENPYLAANGSRGKESLLITPLLKVAEGEKMSVDVARANYNQSGDDVFLKVYYSADRQNWTLAKTISSDELSSQRAVSSTYYYGVLKTFVIDNIPAGNYYIGFGAGYTCLDNIYGFERVAVAHDLMATAKKLPSVAVVNNKYEAQLTVKNLNTEAEAADSYTVTLYANGDSVAAAQTSDIAAGAEATFDFAYTPHAAGAVKVYAQLKSLTDGYTLTTDTTDVTVSEEKAVSELVIGAESSKETNKVFYFYYADNAEGGLCDFIYTPEMLTQFGLKAGDKVAGVSFAGVPQSSKTMQQMHQTFSYGMVDAASYEPGEGLDALTTVTLNDGGNVELDEAKDYISNITLPEALVWDGTSAIRFYTYVKSDARSYGNVKYPVDANFSTFNYKSGTGSSWSNSSTPVVTLSIQKEPTAITGVVKSGDAPVADATVTLTSDDVIYTGKTNEEGAYDVPVIQTEKTYTLTVTADGYVPYTEEGISLADSVVRNITLKKTTATVEGTVVYRNAGVAGATVSLTSGELNYTATTTDEGAFSVADVKAGVKYEVKVAADKFNSYADSVFVEDDITLAAIELSKPDVKVYGQVKWGDTPLEGVLVEYTTVDNVKDSVFTDAEGKYEFADLKADSAYAICAVDTTGEFSLSDTVSVNTDVDAEQNFTLAIKPITITIDKTGYTTFSYKRALNFAELPDLKAYAVTGITDNYTDLSEVSEAPANTGVLLQAAAGTYTLTPVETAAAVENNLLVATTDAAFTISADSVGKAWALTDNADTQYFTSTEGTVVPQGAAYLQYESDATIIFLSQAAAGIRGIDASAANGLVDYSKPMYNLAGQKVGKNFKGVVIQNGKKIIVK